MLKKILTGMIVAGVAAQADVSYTALGQVYSQDFDSLGNVDGTSYTFDDNSTIPGWYANSEEMDTNSDEYFGEDGSSTAGEVYSFGADGVAERALGYVGSGGNDYTNFSVVLTNDTGATIDEIFVSYTGEQWRSGGDTSDNNNDIKFAYRVFSADGGSMPASTDLTDWTAVGGLDFTPPQSDVAAGALDGNDAANQTLFEDISVSGIGWGAGEDLWLRFVGNDGSGSDAGLAVDDFSMTTVPEPAALGLLALAGAAVARRRR